MGRKQTAAWVGVALALCLGFVSAAPQEKKPWGLEPFTPTKMQWFLLTMNMQVGQSLAGTSHHYRLSIIPSENMEEVIIYVRYYPELTAADRELMNEHIKAANAAIRHHLKIDGHEGTPVREDVQKLEN